MSQWQRKFAGALALALMSSNPALSEETVLMESTVGEGGLICDKPEEVEAYLKLMETGQSHSDALDRVDGCGNLLRPTLMRVVAIKTFETGKGKYLIVRYDFLSFGNLPQFGVGVIKRKGQDF